MEVTIYEELLASNKGVALVSVKTNMIGDTATDAAKAFKEAKKELRKEDKE